jgi:hypothetical protein
VAEIVLADYGITKAQALAALFNASHPQGRGFERNYKPEMSVKEAQKLLDVTAGAFDYVRGRVLKVDLTGASFNPWLYDRDNGEGAAHKALTDCGPNYWQVIED